MRMLPAIAIVSAMLGLGTLGLAAQPAQASGEFTPVPALTSNVAFWKKVYIEWSINEIAFHDEQDLGVVYRVIKVPPHGEKRGGLTRSATIKRGKAELEEALRALARKKPTSGEGLSGLEKEVWSNLKNVSRADKYTRPSTIRAQNGLRERFLQGWANSGLYEQFITAELKRNGLPEELIGVAFVESLFYVGARSKVGAAGVWQFMDYTGKEYMNLNAVVDERYDPILATEAACKYLKTAKNQLGTWPLAVTSYNYGRSGMRRLAADAGTKDFGTILAVSKNKRFGFAARNYYASFLAVLEILKERDTLLAGVSRKAPWNYDVIRAPFALYTTQIVGTGLVSASALDVLNPGLTIAARDGKVPLPHGMSLRVPKGKSDAILQKLAALPARERARAGQAVKTTHTANGRQSIATIAKRMGVSQVALAAAVGLPVTAVPRKGQKLPIPHASARTTLLPEARGMPAPPATAAGPILLAASSEPEPEPKPTRAAVVNKPKVVDTRGTVKLGPITVEAITDDLPGVDVVAGTGSLTVPPVDVIAGDPGSQAPWNIPAPQAPALADAR